MQTPEDITSCVKRASDLYLSGKKAAGLDVIYETYDDLMHAGQFDVISVINKSIDLKNTSSAVLLAVIINTRFALSKIDGSLEFSLKAIAELESRPDFDKSATVHIKSELQNKKPIEDRFHKGGILYSLAKLFQRKT